MLKRLKGKVRRVVRLTLVKKGNEKEKLKELSNMEKEHVSQYVKLIRKAEPDFIHVKGFKSLGYSRKRIGYSKQPFHKEVKDFSLKLAEELKKDEAKKLEIFGSTKSKTAPTRRNTQNFVGYKILAEEERSCVVLLGKDRKNMRIKESEI